MLPSTTPLSCTSLTSRLRSRLNYVRANDDRGGKRGGSSSPCCNCLALPCLFHWRQSIGFGSSCCLSLCLISHQGYSHIMSICTVRKPNFY
uniref:Uncharacterized protein n=1 Tax=Arundo donax TaxID=35708 RepID=A0A0A9CQ33_ARUDO